MILVLTAPTLGRCDSVYSPLSIMLLALDSARGVSLDVDLLGVDTTLTLFTLSLGCAASSDRTGCDIKTLIRSISCPRMQSSHGHRPTAESESEHMLRYKIICMFMCLK